MQMKLAFLIPLFLAWEVSRVCSDPPVANTLFSVQLYANIRSPRGLLLDDAGDILVVARRFSQIIALRETRNPNGTVSVSQTVIVNASRLFLNHGIAYKNGFLYASSSVAVYRWPYRPGQRKRITASPQIVITRIPARGHITRTLAFDSRSTLYISIGSFSNIDNTSSRARIRRFDLSRRIPRGGILFSSGEVFADGLRNEVGLAFDTNGILWGVENGPDRLNHAIFGDVHNTNPAEELHKFTQPVGTFHGYPYCWSSYILEGRTAGTQFAWPSFNDGIHTDDWCRNVSNNFPPALPLPAHTAPLGITFYDGVNCNASVGAFPCSWTGDAIIAFHGSWNSDEKVGYKVTRYRMDSRTRDPTGQVTDIVSEGNRRCSNCFRPVNAIFDKNGHLIVSSDASDEIFIVYYNATPPVIANMNNRF